MYSKDYIMECCCYSSSVAELAPPGLLEEQDLWLQCSFAIYSSRSWATPHIGHYQCLGQAAAAFSVWYLAFCCLGAAIQGDFCM